MTPAAGSPAARCARRSASRGTRTAALTGAAVRSFRPAIGCHSSPLNESKLGLLAAPPARWLLAGLSGLVLVIGIVAAVRLSGSPQPLPPVALPPIAVPPGTAPDAQAAATSMAESLALGNPEVVQHLLFQLQRQTGCRARAQSHVVDSRDPAAVADEREARAERLAALEADPAVQSAGHGSATVPDSTSVYHVVLAVVC